MKRSVTRIHNKDKIYLSRALVVSVAKIENDDCYKSMVDARRLLQTRLAVICTKKEGLPVCSCGLDMKSSNFKPI